MTSEKQRLKDAKRALKHRIADTGYALGSFGEGNMTEMMMRLNVSALIRVSNAAQTALVSVLKDRLEADRFSLHGG